MKQARYKFTNDYSKMPLEVLKAIRENAYPNNSAFRDNQKRIALLKKELSTYLFNLDALKSLPNQKGYVLWTAIKNVENKIKTARQDIAWRLARGLVLIPAPRVVAAIKEKELQAARKLQRLGRIYRINGMVHKGLIKL